MNFIRKQRELLHELYDFSVIIKGVDGFLEIIGGLLLIFFSPLAITRTVLFLGRTELVGNPRHPFINFIYGIASGVSVHRRYVYSFLFLSHGAVKLILVGGLVRNKIWAYPTTIIIFTVFAFYQSFEIYSNPSPLLAVITLIDIFVVLLISREFYRVVTSNQEIEHQ